MPVDRLQQPLVMLVLAQAGALNLIMQDLCGTRAEARAVALREYPDTGRIASLQSALENTTQDKQSRTRKNCAEKQCCYNRNHTGGGHL